MKRINHLIQKLASSALKAAPLAIVVAGLFATSPAAFAACSFTWAPNPVHVNPGASFGPAGTLKGIAGSEVYVETFGQSGNFTLQNLQVGYNSVAVPAKGAVLLPSSPFNVDFTAIVPSSAMAGETAQVTMQVFDIFGDLVCSSTVTVVVAGTPCSQKMTEWNGDQFTATWDSVHCYVEPVPTGATPFIYNNAYYVNADKSTTCLVGSWDGANCWFRAQPIGGFLWQDSFYVKPGVGNTCSLGKFDGANCLVQTAPWGTHAFLYTISGQVMWYFTPQFTCKAGGYDGAHCYIMTAPAGTTAFIYNNAFYYAE